MNKFEYFDTLVTENIIQGMNRGWSLVLESFNEELAEASVLTEANAGLDEKIDYIIETYEG